MNFRTRNVTKLVRAHVANNRVTHARRFSTYNFDFILHGNIIALLGVLKKHEASPRTGLRV